MRIRHLLHSVVGALGRLETHVGEFSTDLRGSRTWRRIELFLIAISSLASVTAVVIAITGLRSSGDFSERMLSQLRALDSAFVATSRNLQNLPPSIAKFDSSVGAVSALVELESRRLVSVVDSLRNAVELFESGLKSYAGHLDKIVVASDRQLELLSRRHELLELELGRKSDLRLRFEAVEVDSGMWRVTPVVINTGSAPSSFYTFFFDLPTETEFEGEAYSVQRKEPGGLHVTFTISQPIGFSSAADTAITNSPQRSIFTLRKGPPSGAIRVQYTILYEHGSRSEFVDVRPLGAP